MNGTIFVTMMALFIPTPLLFAREAQTAAPDKMKAIVLHEYGGPAVLNYEDAPRPEPKDDEVLFASLRRRSIPSMSRSAPANMQNISTPLCL